MKLVAAACPSCSAGIEVPEGADRCFCMYCGSQIIVEAALAYAKVKIEGTVQVKNADFVIEAGKLLEYHGESQSPSIPDSVQAIGERAFAKKLMRSVSIPKSVVRIECCAFEHCFNLEFVALPDSVIYLGGSAFGNCSSLKRAELPDSIQEMIACFRDCSSLEDVKLPNGISEIGYEMFKGCSSLKEVTIPDSVEHIGYHAFEGCSMLERIVLPKSLKTMGDDAFKGCSSLKEIHGFDKKWQSEFEDTPFMSERHKKWKSAGLCANCGGELKRGLLGVSCRSCGRS